MSEAIIEFTVPAVPIAQPRPRARVQGQHARVYEPKRHPVSAFKATVRLAAQQNYSGPPLEGALRIDATFVFPRPKSLVWKTKPMPRVWHVTKPDRDNCDKSVLDALAGTMFVNDSQVCAGTLEKWIAAGDEQPHVRVRIERIAADEAATT